MFRTVSNGAYAPTTLSRIDADDDQRDISLATLARGGYVAVWFDVTYPGTVKARRFDGNGGKVGTEVDVGQGRGQPAVAAALDGGFIVTWKRNAYSEDGIRARLFDADANPLGDVRTISTTNTVAPEMPEVTALAKGGYVARRATGSTCGGSTPTATPPTATRRLPSSAAAPSRAPPVSCACRRGRTAAG
jgi:hypothetical protein